MDALKLAIIHSLDRESPQGQFEVTYREDALDSENKVVQSLAKQLVSLIGKEGSSVTWGQFRDDRREGPFPESVQALTAQRDVEQFVLMSRTAMEELRAAAQAENFATGGYVCFLVYEHQEADFLLVAIIKERGALMLSANFEPTEIIEMDLSKLHQAARINLTRYSDFLAGPDEAEDDDTDRTYLSFINRSSRQEAASYFVDALGCEKGISSAKATTAVIVAVNKYVKSVPQTKALASTARLAVIDYMTAQPEGASITLDTIVTVVEHAVGVDLCPHLEGLREALNSEQYKIPNEFTINRKTLSTYSRIKAKADNWQISFENGALGTQDSDIIYNRAEHSLKLMHLPDDLVAKVEEALAARDARVA